MPQHKQELKTVVERLRETHASLALLERNGVTNIWRPTSNARAALLEAADLLQSLEGERDEAVKQMTHYAREAGEAKGRLEMSEAAGIVAGWQERTATAEARVRELEEALERINAATAASTNSRTIDDYRGWVGAVAATALHKEAQG